MNQCNITQKPLGGDTSETKFAACPDSRLFAAARCDPPNLQALDELIDRHWKGLFAQCQMLTVNANGASDLAQAALRRVLKARQSHPPADFRAHLIRTATEIWRDQARSLPVSPALATRLQPSFGAPQFVIDGEDALFTGAEVADVNDLSGDDRARLRREIDSALEKLTLRDRDALLSRHLNGQSQKRRPSPPTKSRSPQESATCGR